MFDDTAHLARRCGQTVACCVFCGVLATLVGLAFWVQDRRYDLRTHPINFYALSDKNLVVEQGLTRIQTGMMKLGFIEKYHPPRIGLFGNHQFRYFGGDSLMKDPAPIDFFNFWYANLSLTEVRDYLAYLEAIGKLPTKTILVQITSPNNDNGDYIVGYKLELPPDLIRFGDRSSSHFSLLHLKHHFETLRRSLKNALKYSSFIFGVIGTRNESRIVDLTVCESGSDGEKLPRYSRILNRVPKFVRKFLGSGGMSHAYCERALWANALRRDGSYDGRFRRHNPVLNRGSLDATKAHLHPVDIPKLAATMRDIEAIGKRNGRKVAFIVPPVYETDRDSSVDRVLTAAIEKLPGTLVIDHRKFRGGPDYFIKYDHPGPKYFRLLAQDLRRLSLID